ncbi:MAG: GIY-YIG nuclease family protein [Rhodanobacteraceae bacterium]|nr:MAG: GIY-YIG nuclease family protein [Rhodanobacteraceae bacterium]
MKKQASNERANITRLRRLLNKQPLTKFPPPRGRLTAPFEQCVYVIRDSKRAVVHVGRTLRGNKGLRQRLNDHLAGQSSFVKSFLHGEGKRLRDGYTYQCLAVPDARARALLESCAVAWHCPAHLGLGEGKL